MSTRLAVICSVATVFALWVGQANAQLDAVFKGNQARVCMNSTGYDDSLALQNFGSVASGTDAVVTTFRRDGTGTQDTKSLSLFHGATFIGATPAVQSDSSCSFTYTIDANGLINMTFGPCASTTLTGPNAGQTSVLGAIVAELALVDRTTLISVGTTPSVETITNSNGFVTERVCHRTSTRFLTR